MSKSVCAICAGTGKTLHMRSWFAVDGFYCIRCGICGGTGKSRYRDGAYEKEQRTFREQESSR